MNSEIMINDDRSMITNENPLNVAQPALSTLSQRNMQKALQNITKHLENELEESRDGPKDNISINMIEISMDFNELQKRFNDMNNPDFWLQKAI